MTTLARCLYVAMALGAACVAFGAALIYPPAAFVVIGIALIAGALFIAEMEGS